MRDRALLPALLVCVALLSPAVFAEVGLQLSHDIIARHQPTINAIAGNGWDHANSVVLHGMEKIYRKTQDKKLLAYIRSYVDEFVNEEGDIKALRNSLDGIHPGVLCLFLYEETGEKKYWKAAKKMRDHLLGTGSTPGGSKPAIRKTPEGGFWHKDTDKYRNVMSVDGAYMAYPFLLRFGLLANDSQAIDAALFQTLLVSERSFNFEKGLPYHAWDYSKTRSWANPKTGQSSQFWSRASGWYAMALVDMLEVLPSADAHYAKLLRYYQALAAGLTRWQDPQSHMWFQVLDKVNKHDNYPEMAGTGMMVYSLAKGARLGLLDETAKSSARKAWIAMASHIKPYEDGGLQVTSVAPGMGCQDNYAAYVAIRPVSIPTASGKQHTHGYMSVLLAASEME